jgi:ADP-L-glycero-D-manno-heptose 6-epimerase
MIVITGAAGFIASALITRLQAEGAVDLVLVDDFSRPDRERNYLHKPHHLRVDRREFIGWLESNAASVSLVYHLGARTDTTEFDRALLNELNVAYSQHVWDVCTRHAIPLVYASSAATYGLGEHGFDDDHSTVARLKPLNPYGDSKNEFDRWVLGQQQTPPHWKGVKFFNVFGPNEYHKGRMASVVLHTYKQVAETGKMRLFKSHNPAYADGEQLRDFIYVKDVVEVLFFLSKSTVESGLYNLGTGQARTFKDLALATFKALNKPAQVEFMDTPEDIRNKYQYFTEAKMEKLRRQGYTRMFTPLEAAVEDYVVNYLTKDAIY